MLPLRDMGAKFDWGSTDVYIDSAELDYQRPSSIARAT